MVQYIINSLIETWIFTVEYQTISMLGMYNIKLNIYNNYLNPNQ